jgi:glycosyltransferase involved in cell wall biosynthesis
MMTGIPIVSIGGKLANSIFRQNTYEVPSIIQNCINGFCYDDIEKLKNATKRLLEDGDLAISMGSEGRETAISLFGKSVIKEQWRQFLSNL